MSEPRYHAHTAEGPDETRLPESSGLWQLLSTHLRNVAQLARRFAAPLGFPVEAELAGLLHDLGKYAQRFQARLRDNSIHGVNHWAAGAARVKRSPASDSRWEILRGSRPSNRRLRDSRAEFGQERVWRENTVRLRNQTNRQ